MDVKGEVFMNEIWKVIEDSDGHYWISNMGRMKRDAYSFVSATGRRISVSSFIKDSGSLNRTNGYLYYSYRRKDGSSKSDGAHRIVAFTFCENKCPEIYKEVNHIDGNKQNNCSDNLEWVNRKKNMEHASKHGLINRESPIRKKQAPINARKGAIKTSKQWCIYDKDGNYVDSIRAKGGQNKCCRLTYKGQTWRDANILIERYGKVPMVLDVSRSFRVANCKRKYYKEIVKDGTENIYTTLKEVPITREQIWFCFNHSTPDKNGSMWDIIEAKNGTIKSHRKIVMAHIIAYDENGNKCHEFKSKTDCLNFLGIKGCSALNKALKLGIKYHGYYWKDNGRKAEEVVING